MWVKEEEYFLFVGLKNYYIFKIPMTLNVLVIRLGG